MRRDTILFWWNFQPRDRAVPIGHDEPMVRACVAMMMASAGGRDHVNARTPTLPRGLHAFYGAIGNDTDAASVRRDDDGVPRRT